MSGRFSWCLIAIVMLAIMPCRLVRATESYTIRTMDGIERSMLVTGQIEIDAEGLVQRYQIAHREALPPAVLQVLDANVPRLTFEPVVLPEGQEVTRSSMSLRLVAYRTGEDAYTTWLRGISLRPLPSDEPDTHRMRPLDTSRIEYPPRALKVGVSAIVYIALHIDRQGAVMDASVRQINLRMSGNERQLTFWREVFARELLLQVKRLRFAVPTTGPYADAPSWTITMPLDFAIHGETPEIVPGRWDLYRPGPVHDIPWQQTAEQPSAPDTTPAAALQSDREHRQRRATAVGD